MIRDAPEPDSAAIEALCKQCKRLKRRIVNAGD